MNDEELDALIAASTEVSSLEGQHPDDGALLALREGRLEAAARGPVEAHLARCQECRALLAALAEPVPASLHEFGVRRVTRRRRPWLLGAGGALAAAAALLFTVIATRPQPRAEMPAYELLGPSGGLARTRAGGSSADFLPASRLQISLRPQDDLRGPAPELQVFVEGRRGGLEARPQLDVQRSPEGAFRLTARAQELVGTSTGTYVLHLIVGPPRAWPERLPDPGALRRLLTTEAYLRTEVRLVRDPTEDSP